MEIYNTNFSMYVSSLNYNHNLLVYDMVPYNVKKLRRFVEEYRPNIFDQSKLVCKSTCNDNYDILITLAHDDILYSKFDHYVCNFNLKIFDIATLFNYKLMVKD